MIDLELLNESESIELKLDDNSKGGTKNYNDLDNKPKINGKELKGNLSLEDLGIIVNAVKDILVNGATIVENGVANIPIASANDLGLIKQGNGLYMANGKLCVLVADTSHIDKRSKGPVLKVESLGYAIKSAMCTDIDDEWSATEKAMARARMGIELVPMLDAPLVIEEDLVGAMNIELPTPCEQVLMLVKQPKDTTSISLYSGIVFEGQYTTGAGNLMGAVDTKPNGYCRFELTLLDDGVVECVTLGNNGFCKGVISRFEHGIGKKIAKVGLSSISATLPKGTEIIVLGK